jgi:molybdopterin-guanine dinucleotide biosynthesis protein A
MPSISPALVGLLLDRAAARPDGLAVMCRGERGLEPLLSVWRPAAAPLLRAALDDGVRSLHDAVELLPAVVVLAPEEWRHADPDGASFANWNSPGDVPAIT